ncbi:hypothetical protein BH11PSE3_BH11PSE3_06120 [soil metagenome]
MERPALLLALLLAWSTQVEAQQCTAGGPGPDALWAVAPIDDTQAAAPLKVMNHLRCLGCGQDLSMLLAAGPASAAFRNSPIGQKTGRAWAEAVVEDPGQRDGFLRGLLRSDTRSSPGCSLQGSVGGIVEVGELSMIRTEIHAECTPQPTLQSGEFYSGYDGRCLYQVQFVWGPGFQALSPQGHYALQSLLKSVRFRR